MSGSEVAKASGHLHPGADEVSVLLEVLPEPLRAEAATLTGTELLELIMDLGRRPEARMVTGVRRLADELVQVDDLQYVMDRIGPLSDDNRAGIERTLHRISAIKNRKGDVIGLTLRVGRAVFGTIDMLRDLIQSGRNVLLLGRPGVGKTTKLREMARVLADDLGKRVVVVDTSNEIGGDGDVPHPGIGSSRRMQVSRPELQHAVMIEAVENHMPEVIIVDEIGTAAEAAAARTIAERGVQLIATAHGTTLENLVLNPTLSDLVGGVHTVTLGDEEARRRGTPKTITERRGPPTFDCVVEIVDRHEVVAHIETADAVDRLLAGESPGGERRRMVDGRVERQPAEARPRPAASASPFAPPPSPDESPGDALAQSSRTPARVHAYAISRDLIRRVLEDMRVEARVVDDPARADVVIALRSRADDRSLRRSLRPQAQLQIVKKNSSSEIRRALRRVFPSVAGVDEREVREAVSEAEHAIARVLSEGVAIPLAPRPRELRRVQHRLVSRYHLEAESDGREPYRRLVIHPHARPAMTPAPSEQWEVWRD